MAQRFILTFAFLNLFFSPVGFAGCEAPADIVESLNCLPGVTSREVLAPEDPQIPAGYRRFELTLEQPVDHFSKKTMKFKQRLALLHKETNEPLVLQTSGYSIFAVKLSAIAKTFRTNQIQIEHRFFSGSTPAVMDWSKLDIVQSANDFHRVVETFKQIYKGRWVNTGASKGGMTSVYHRRFFPGDLDGTVADVAPLSFSTEDPRYINFVDTAGGEAHAECREKLEALQVALLQRRSEMYDLIPGSYVYLGGKSVAFEHAVIELPFVFWQYKKPDDAAVGCAQIPAPDAPAADVMAWVQKVNEISGYGDTDIFSFMPYYFQAATQLGAPASKRQHLPVQHKYHVNQYTPPGVKLSYTNAAMLDVEEWTRTEAERIMFVYGEFDPWSAAAFPKSKNGEDFHWYLVPGGHHGSNFVALPAEEKAAATATLARWLDKKASVMNRMETTETLDTFEFEYRRKHHLR